MALPDRFILCAFVSLLACRSAPEEPARPTPEVSQRASVPMPSVADQALRVLAALSDGGGAPSASEVLRLELALPPSVDVIAVHTLSGWTVAALEASRVSLGTAGAERVLALWRDRGHSPSAPELARVVGAFAYYPFRVYVAPERVPGAPRAPPQVAPGATLVNRPGATGQSLTFSYQIPQGAGEGVHVAHFNVTQSGFIIDEAPNPALR